MRKIWYLLKCQEGNETDCLNRCLQLIDCRGIEEILCFQYQRMIRYGGEWHLERRIVLPGYIFLSGTDVLCKKMWEESQKGSNDIFMTPCEVPYLKTMCQNGSLVGISRGIIQNGTVIVTSGPLKGREYLIQKIDRHKRIAEIEIPLAGDRKRMMVGLEIYEKVM